MKLYKKFTILVLALLGFTSQTVLANDDSNAIGSSTTSSANASQATTENQPTTPSSSEQETKSTLPTESKLQTGWVKEDGKWAYYSQTGVKFTDTLYEGYLFDKNGYLLENSWYQMANKWYYANGSGKYLSNQWSQINGKWYAFDQNGAMMANTWKGNYYLKSSGAMADKEWVYDPNYSSWFYLKLGGHYAERQWVGSYYLKSGGYMAHMIKIIKLGIILKKMAFMSLELIPLMEVVIFSKIMVNGCKNFQKDLKRGTIVKLFS